jgi:hypothetical protein
MEDFLKDLKKGDRVRVVQYTHGEAGHASVHVVLRRNPGGGVQTGWGIHGNSYTQNFDKNGRERKEHHSRHVRQIVGPEYNVRRDELAAATKAAETNLQVCRDAVTALQEKLAAALLAQKTAEDMVLAAQKAERGEK